MTSVKRDGRVEFRFFRPGVTQVKVAGDFNGWSHGGDGALEMRPQDDGWWAAEAKLDAGEYRFRYLADGTWFTDFASHGVEMSKLGWNSVLVVPAEKDVQEN